MDPEKAIPECLVHKSGFVFCIAGKHMLTVDCDGFKHLHDAAVLS